MQYLHSRIYLVLEEVDASVENDPILHMPLRAIRKSSYGTNTNSRLNSTENICCFLLFRFCGGKETSHFG